MIDAATFDWLRSVGLVAKADNEAAQPFGDMQADSEIRCPFDSLQPAQEEAARQLGFLGPARAIETLRVDGRQAALIGRSVTLVADAAGYSAGLDVFIIGVNELDNDDATILTVVRRL